MESSAAGCSGFLNIRSHFSLFPNREYYFLPERSAIHPLAAFFTKSSEIHKEPISMKQIRNMREIILITALAVMILDIFVLPAMPPGSGTLSFASDLRMADGGSPFPMCGPVPCLSQVKRSEFETITSDVSALNARLWPIRVPLSMRPDLIAWEQCPSECRVSMIEPKAD
ncbi:MAG TPA: hypothetical protein VNW97_14785 [Candidatus Saccharimonadales bacterium]|jgi:hypothetical protein|nr:hypothetical protein [Candidatus Saccharimonadales bacterium]